VPRSATFKEHRKGFLEIAKRYHPGRLPNDVAPSLLRANMAVYQYLTEVLLDLEAKLADSPAPALSPVVPVAPPARASAPPPPPRPSSPRPVATPAWQLDALHLRQEQERLKGSLTVTRETAFVFSAHRLMNLANEAVFFPCQPSLALGTRLELLFRFPEAARDVISPGAVAWENSQPGGVLRGFGVRLSLRTEEKGFMLREAQRLQQAVAR
jgi:Tfp pilus assembly protein PilZ